MTKRALFCFTTPLLQYNIFTIFEFFSQNIKHPTVNVLIFTH